MGQSHSRERSTHVSWRPPRRAFVIIELAVHIGKISPYLFIFGSRGWSTVCARRSLPDTTLPEVNARIVYPRTRRYASAEILETFLMDLHDDLSGTGIEPKLDVEGELCVEAFVLYMHGMLTLKCHLGTGPQT